MDKLLSPEEMKQHAESAEASAQSAEVEAASAADAALRATAELNEVLQNKTKEVNGWNVSAAYYRSPDSLFKDFERNAISATVGSVRRGSSDIVTVSILVKNLRDDALKYSASMTSADSESDARTPSYDRAVSDIFVAPNSSSTKQINLIIRKKEIDPGKRTIWVELFINSMSGETLRAQKVIELVEGV